MASFVIEGGHKLHGEITPQGAKNEVLQILCATLLTQPTVLTIQISFLIPTLPFSRTYPIKVRSSGP